ncbi:MAG: hypothetical protein RBT80_24275 [Candidatus Vecturithrix sp.]|jgi:hypothetical protein|nr:hypothetical protein [Candidatus Vecturithrix sp.]
MLLQRILSYPITSSAAAIMKNQGFFTTDERPEYGVRYGISQNEYLVIFQLLSAHPHGDLLVLFVYSLSMKLNAIAFSISQIIGRASES